MILRNLDTYTLGGSFCELTSADLEAWLDAVPRGPRTRTNYLSCMTCFYRWAISAGHTDENPAAKIDRPRLPRSLPRPIGRTDLAVAVATATPMVRAWLCLAALAGLRCQEIAGITREDVWDQEEQPMLFVRDGKGGSERTVPLHPDALDALRQCGMPRFGPIFRNNGRPYHPNRVSRIGNDHLHSLGIESTMHQLRHRFGTDVQALGKDIRVTQELMGHQSPQSTAIYTAVNPVHATAVVNLLTLTPRLHAVAG